MENLFYRYDVAKNDAMDLNLPIVFCKGQSVDNNQFMRVSMDKIEENEKIYPLKISVIAVT